MKVPVFFDEELNLHHTIVRLLYNLKKLFSTLVSCQNHFIKIMKILIILKKYFAKLIK